MKYRIINGTLLIKDKDGYSTGNQTLYIDGDRIAGIGTVPDDWDFTCETVNAGGQLIIPGLINMHTHAYMTVMRNYADDVDFGEWLFQKVMPVEDRLPAECGYWTTMLGLIEMIRTGTTSFVDMHMFPGMVPAAVRDAGLRAWLGRGLVGEDLYTDGFIRFSQALEEKDGYEDERIRFVLSPHAIYSASPRLYSQVTEESHKRGMLRQTHLSESETEVADAVRKYGKTPVEVLAETGFLDDAILAHCVKLQGQDIGILAAHHSHIVTNPASNAKLGNGFAPVSEIVDAGINLCLGTDGAASNNTLNMFREMGLLTMIHKGVKESSVAMPSGLVLDAASGNGARALGMENRLGVIRTGALADLVFLDLNSISLFPPNNMVSSLCYSAQGSEVVSTMVGGRFLMRDRRLLTVDCERVYYEIKRIADDYL